MSYDRCPRANKDCPLWNQHPVVPGEESGCRSNEHHIYKRDTAKDLGKTAIKFANLPRNRVQLCETLHRELESKYGWPEFPPTEFMQAVIESDKNK